MPNESSPGPGNSLGPFQALGRVARIFYAPRRVAGEIREHPNWVFPLLLSLLLAFLTASVLFARPEWQQVLDKALASSGRKMGELERIQLLRVLRGVSWAGFLAAPIIGSVFLAVVLWGMVVLRRSAAGFLPVFSFQLHAQMLTLIPQTITVALLLTPARNVATGPAGAPPYVLAYYLPAAGVPDALRSLALAVDLFSFWYWLVILAGLAVVAGLPRRRLLVPVSLLYLMGLLVRAAAARSFTGGPP